MRLTKRKYRSPQASGATDHNPSFRGSVNHAPIRNNEVSGTLYSDVHLDTQRTTQPDEAAIYLLQLLVSGEYGCATSLADSFPATRIADLLGYLRAVTPSADSIWQRLTGDHLLYVLWSEAIAHGTSDQLARSLLYRTWYQSVNRPGKGFVIPNLHHIFADWCYQLPTACHDTPAIVASALSASGLSPLWRPRSADDPNLVKIVTPHWQSRLSWGGLLMDLGDGAPVLAHFTVDDVNRAKPPMELQDAHSAK